MVADFHAELARRWDFDAITADVIASQRSRRVVGQASPGPLKLPGLRAGRHEVKLELQDSPDDLFAVDLLAHEHTSLTRTMDSGGEVELASDTRATATIDGVKRGEVPLLLRLPSGQHAATMTAPGRVPVTQSFAVTQGQRTVPREVYDLCAAFF